MQSKIDWVLRVIMVVIMAVAIAFIGKMYKDLPQTNYTFNSRDYTNFDMNQDTHFAFEEYDVTSKKITCKGWFVLDKAKAKDCKKMIVFLGTRDSHLFYKMNTTRVNRKDVDEYCKKRISDPQEYLESGFTASIDRSRLRSDTYNFYIYYESNTTKVMRKLPYKIII